MQGVTSVYHTGVTESQTAQLSHDPNFPLTTVDAVPSQTSGPYYESAAGSIFRRQYVIDKLTVAHCK